MKKDLFEILRDCLKNCKVFFVNMVCLHMCIRMFCIKHSVYFTSFCLFLYINI